MVKAVFGRKDCTYNESKQEITDELKADNDTLSTTREKYTENREYASKYELTLATATNEYGILQTLRPTKGAGESHDNIIPILGDILENLMKYSVEFKKKHLIKTDNLSKNKNIGKKVIRYLKEKYADGIIWHCDGLYYYDLNAWEDNGTLLVCLKLHMVTNDYTLITNCYKFLQIVANCYKCVTVN